MSIRYDYNYIALENIEVTSFGKAELHKMENHTEMPLSYIFNAEKYNLFFDLDKKSYWPSIYIKALNHENEELNIDIESGNICGSVDKYKSNKKIVRYSWLPDHKVACTEIEEQKLKSIVVTIIDNNRILGAEEIMFEIVNNGYFYLADGI